MTAWLKRLKRARWTFKQPLTHVPSQSTSPVSDLFVWRRDKGWQTFFDLTDMVGLYMPQVSANGVGRRAEIRVFDSFGRKVSEESVPVPLYGRNLLNVSEIASTTDDWFGTFCVFHSSNPPQIAELGSYLSERGYVSYGYLNAPVRGYVHGNLDAVGRQTDGTLELLGGAGPLMREYRLQHELKEGFSYQIAVVNPSVTAQAIECRVMQMNGETVTDHFSARLNAGASHMFEVAPKEGSRRVILLSRLVMARPLIFCLKDNRMDVFHG